MECNRDEAKTAMDIAEKKITEKDYKSAKKFANKAQKMFPELDGLKQLLVTIEVYMSGEKKICGDSDWYGILGVDPLAADVEVRKQYLKLALMLHPDKNKFKGAEGAFNLLSEAWSLLSDSDKRKSYNKKRKIKGTQQTLPKTKSANPPQQPTPSYRSEPVTVESRPKPRGRKGKSSVGSPPFVPPVQKEWFVKRSQRRVRTTHSVNPPNQPACYRPKPCGRMIMVSPPQAQDRGKKRSEVGESQERDAARGFTETDLRNFKRPKTDETGEWSNQTGGSTSGTYSDPAKGDTATPDNIAPK